ncbi:class I SAM-dependent methyltransferase [Photobacterium kishitanii]|nr:class I SAM-dependent methyltransferase [Photobacterium kishitanii]
MQTDSINYYNKNARLYFDATKNIDVSFNQNKFLKYLPPNKGKILDVGCGSGRDSLFFKKKGFDVESIDASIELASLAERYIDSPVKVIKAEEIAYSNDFDGIWCMASLLHTPKRDLLKTFKKLDRALKNNGVIYASFKYGDKDAVQSNERRFTNMDEKSLNSIFSKLKSNFCLDIYKTKDELGTTWINVNAKKTR